VRSLSCFLASSLFSTCVLSGCLAEVLQIPASSPESALPLHGPNIWPSEVLLPGFRVAQEEYMHTMTVLGHRLLRLLALALGLPAAAFESAFTRPMIFLRPLRYAPVRSLLEEGLLGAGAHSDYGMLTILATDHVPGLEVLLASGWVEAPPKPDAFIVNLGDMLERWSNGRFLSTVHRVVNRLGRERFSIPFFFEPNFDTKVKPILQLPAEVPKYEPTTAGEHLLAKYRSTHAGYSDGASHKPT
jgi:isopenicillin N synthase-like dioxygenase